MSQNQHQQRTILEWKIRGELVDPKFTINYFNFSILGLKYPLSNLDYDSDDIEIECRTRQYRLTVPKMEQILKLQPRGIMTDFKSSNQTEKKTQKHSNISASLTNRLKDWISDDQKEWITSLQVSLIPFGIVAAFFVLR